MSLLNTNFSFFYLAVTAVLLVLSCSDGGNSLKREERIEYLFKQSEDMDSINSKKYLDSLEVLLLKSENDSITRRYIFKLSGKRYSAGQMESYLELTQMAYGLSIKGSDTLQAAKALYFVGDYFEQITKPDSALHYYNAAEKLYGFMHDSVNIGKMKLYKGGILFDTGNYDDSESQAIFALALLSKSENQRLEYECLNLIALSLKEMNDYSNSLKYFDKALETLELLRKNGYPAKKNAYSRASCYNNIGLVYARLENYSTAQDYYLNALRFEGIQADRPKLYAMLLHNLAVSKLKTHRNDEAEALLMRSLKIRQDLHNLPGIISSKIGLGEYYLEVQDTASAIMHIRESYEMARMIKSHDDILTSLQLLAENDKDNKEKYSRLFFHVNDSLKSEDRERRNRFARIAFETDAILEQNEVLVKKNTYVLLLSVILASLAAASILIFQLRAKNKKLVFERNQQQSDEMIYSLLLEQKDERVKARDTERQRIAMELHDGIINRIFTTRFALMQLRSYDENKQEKIVQELQKTEKDIRIFSRDLADGTKDLENNLGPILYELVSEQKNEFNTKFDFTPDPMIDWSRIGAARQMHIYRIVQEALQNVNRYSRASLCCVLMMKKDGYIIVRIWDNGIGFDPAKSRKGLGLANMADRASKAGAEIRIISKPDQGTTVELTL